jgi:hypothetical protein
MALPRFPSDWKMPARWFSNSKEHRRLNRAMKVSDRAVVGLWPHGRTGQLNQQLLGCRSEKFVEFQVGTAVIRPLNSVAPGNVRVFAQKEQLILCWMDRVSLVRFQYILIWADAHANLPAPGKVDRESGCGLAG